MKKIMLILIFLINSNILANEFELDTNGSSETEGIIVNANSKFRLYKSTGYWKVSSGDYGTVKCFGTLKNDKNENVQFEVYCKLVSQEKEHFILKF